METYKLPRSMVPMMPPFFREDICKFMISGMGTHNTITSFTMLMMLSVINPAFVSPHFPSACDRSRISQHGHTHTTKAGSEGKGEDKPTYADELRVEVGCWLTIGSHEKPARQRVAKHEEVSNAKSDEEAAAPASKDPLVKDEHRDLGAGHSHAIDVDIDEEVLQMRTNHG